MRKRMQQYARQAIDQIFTYGLQHRYAHTVSLAKKYAHRYKVPFTKEQKHFSCKYCNTLLTTNAMRIRIHRKKIIRTCLTCKKQRRIPLHTKKSSEKKIILT